MLLIARPTTIYSKLERNLFKCNEFLDNVFGVYSQVLARILRAFFYMNMCGAVHPVFYDDGEDIHLNPKIGAVSRSALTAKTAMWMATAKFGVMYQPLCSLWMNN